MTTKCICGTSATVEFGKKNGGTVGTCDACGLLRRIDVDENYSQLYTKDLYYHRDLQLAIGHEPYADRFTHDVDVAAFRWPKLLEEYRLLDVGCANGAFLLYAKQQGMRVAGFEPNVEMATAVAALVDCPVFTAWDQVRGAFDILTFHDVIEHVEDPQAEIDRAAFYLLPGGLLVLDTPDAGCADFARLGMEWHHIRPEQHLWYFREGDLRVLCVNAGLSVTHVDRPIPGKFVLYARKNT